MWRRDKFLELATEFFTRTRMEEKSTRYFLRAMLVFLLLKMTTLWSVSSTFFSEFNPSAPESLFAKTLFLPSLLAGYNVHIFFIVTALFVVILIFLKPSYSGNILFFWITLNLFKIKFPVTNGSDYVLLVMAFYCVPLSLTNFTNPYLKLLNTCGFNLFRILAQIQIALIYLISAWDKVNSEVWRSGEAFEYIGHLDTVFNPVFTGLVEGHTSVLILSWMTIAFEIAFFTLVWHKRTRLIVLGVGVVFHLVIWIMLSLPDFALLMILTYMLFLKDSDYQFIQAMLKRQPH